MNIHFSNPTIRHHCNTETAMHSAYGQACANLLQKRLLQLFAAECLGVFLPPGCRPLICTPHSNKTINKFQLPLDGKYILIFEAIDGEELSDKSGLDWHTIRSIIIYSIEKITHVI